MWDVKKYIIKDGKAIRVEFYLNYVGCKVSVKYSFKVVFQRFYLNYVGCKVSFRPSFKSCGSVLP